MTVVAVVGSAANRTSAALVEAWRALGVPAELLPAREARARLGKDDVALGRLDVLPTLDGVEPGLLELLLLERAGIDVRNGAAALLAVHDKLRTVSCLAAAGIPHPATAVLRSPHERVPLRPPVVLKPRFGSWGKDVVVCASEAEVRRWLRHVAERRWFRRHGVLVQELVGIPRRDLRLVVAGGVVIGACLRTARPGEWRTNVSLGGSRAAVVPAPAACELATRAAAALGADLVGVDLLPLHGGGHSVLELNGAVDFDETYAFAGHSIFADAAAALGLTPAAVARRPVAVTG